LNFFCKTKKSCVMNLETVNGLLHGLHELLRHMDWGQLGRDIFHNLTLRYLVLFWIALRLGRLLTQPYRKLCIAEGKTGNIFLQKSALKDLLIQTCFDQGVRTKPQIAIRLCCRHIEVDVFFKILQHQPLQDLGARLQFELQRLLVDDLGIAKRVKIHLFVTGFLRSQRLPEPVAAPATAEPLPARAAPKFLARP